MVELFFLFLLLKPAQTTPARLLFSTPIYNVLYYIHNVHIYHLSISLEIKRGLRQHTHTHTHTISYQRIRHFFGEQKHAADAEKLFQPARVPLAQQKLCLFPQQTMDVNVVRAYRCYGGRTKCGLAGAVG